MRWTRWIAGVGMTGLVACGSSTDGGESGVGGSGGGSSGAGGSTGGSGAGASSGGNGIGESGGGGAGEAGTSGNSGGAGASGGAGGALASTPIGWADLWVDGFYGTPAARGIDTYSHLDTPGAPDGYYARWVGDPGVTLFSSVTDCSSFSDVLLLRSSGLVLPIVHPGGGRALAIDYYWAVRSGSHFTEITKASDVQVGDVIAILYPADDGTGDTGHVAWIDALPEAFGGPPQPTTGTQLAVTIIDSSHGFHYAPSADTEHQDNRYLGLPPGKSACAGDDECVKAFGANAVCNDWTLASSVVCAYTGVGRGRLRLSVDASGQISGYAWGTNSGSTFYEKPATPPTVPGSTPAMRDVVIGRFVP